MRTHPTPQDNNPAAFSAGELSSILAIWRGVSEDYAPFDIDVTTEEPVGLPLSQWVRAVIGGSSGAGNCKSVAPRDGSAIVLHSPCIYPALTAGAAQQGLCCTCRQ
jgi:hypothetical protein